MIFIILLACNTKEENTSVNTPTIDLLNKSEQPKINNADYKLIWDSYKSLDLKYSLEQLDNTKGLSNSSINTIFQDSENLLWIGTWDGLNRYDGNSFEIFRPELNNKNSLSNQVILKIDEDNTGRIWILTIHGINRYDKKQVFSNIITFQEKTFRHYLNLNLIWLLILLKMYFAL